MKTSTLNTWIGRAGRSVGALLVVLVILIAANLVIRNLRLRADLTQDRLYSLSEGTRRMLGNLEAPVTLKLFFSRGNARIPAVLRQYAGQVEDLLTEYRLAAKGNIRIQTFDPTPDSEEEEWARKYGIAGQSLEMFGPPVYFGLVASAGDAEAVMPALDPRLEAMLEFNISRMIHQVLHPRKPVLGVISSLPVLGKAAMPFAMPGQPPPAAAWMAFQELGQDYDLREIANPEDGIPDEVDVLALIHPKGLSPRAGFAIDQHLLRGGRLVVFVDPMSVADQEGGQAASPYGMPDIRSDLPELFKAWGVHFNADRILADYPAATPMRTPDGDIEHNPTVVTYGPDHLNRDHVLTANLQSLRAAFAGALTASPGEGLEVTPLVTLSRESGSVSPMATRQGARAIREQFQEEPERRHLAIQITGRFKTAFPEGRPKDTDADSGDTPDEDPEDAGMPDPEAAPLTEGESAVVIVADVDMLFDPICVEAVNFFGQTVHRPLNDNLPFFANMVDSLAGGGDLIHIRSRQSGHRRFTRVDALEADAIDQWREQETRLEASLREAQQQINQLQAGKTADQRYILTDSQREAIARFQEREFEIKQELKAVRRNLRQDIERLGIRIKALNMGLMPLAVVLGGMVYGWRRKRASTRSRQTR